MRLWHQTSPNHWNNKRPLDVGSKTEAVAAENKLERARSPRPDDNTNTNKTKPKRASPVDNDSHQSSSSASSQVEESTADVAISEKKVASSAGKKGRASSHEPKEESGATSEVRGTKQGIAFVSSPNR